MSDFYSDQLDAITRFKNPAVFKVNFSVECVKAYLDALHGIRGENVGIVTTLELVKFLKDLARGIFISFRLFFNVFKLDKSQFEGELLTYLCKQLEKVDIDIQTKLLICTIANRFDDFDGHLEQVIDFELTFLQNSPHINRSITNICVGFVRK